VIGKSAGLFWWQLGSGVIRSLLTSPDYNTLDIIPVDMTANAVIAAGWYTATKKLVFCNDHLICDCWWNLNVSWAYGVMLLSYLACSSGPRSTLSWATFMNIAMPGLGDGGHTVWLKDTGLLKLVLQLNPRYTYHTSHRSIPLFTRPCKAYSIYCSHSTAYSIHA